MKTNLHLEGEIGRRIEAVTTNWLLPMPSANPGLLEMFRSRDAEPPERLVAWAGEFAGKYLTHAVLLYRLRGGDGLREHISSFVRDFIACQDDDGYLGPWPKDHHLKPSAPNCANPWDAWGHYHAMLGLMLWNETSGDPSALSATRRIADLLCKRFLGDTGETLHGTGQLDKNHSPLHTLALLHRKTGEPRYLALARQIIQELEIPPAGDFLRQAIGGREFHEMPLPRWESLHTILGFAEMFRATGEEPFREAFVRLWHSMRKTDRHNNGGFTSAEKAQGNPYHPGPIETCCTVAWSAMCVEMLWLADNPDSAVMAADELELSLFNSGLGLISPSGRWVTYNTPMAGRRLASAHDIVFQCRAATPELNCCSVNGPRMLGFLADWALTPHAGGVAINYYGPGAFEVTLDDGIRLQLRQDTDYPLSPDVRITLGMIEKCTFPLAIRIPAWSEQTQVRINGSSLETPQAGRYLIPEHDWCNGDVIEISFDFRPHYWLHPERLPTTPWETEWTVFAPVATSARDYPPRSDDPDPQLPGDHIPETLSIDGRTLEPVLIASPGGKLDFHRHFQRASRDYVAFAFTEIICDRAEIRTLQYSANMWACWFLNGEKLSDNHATGGNLGDGFQQLHRIELPLRAGRNLVLARITSHVGNCWYLPTEWNLNAGFINPGANACFASIYRGPILLTHDPRYNQLAQSPGPLIEPLSDSLQPIASALPGFQPWMLFETPTAVGATTRLCDFASAGFAGGPPYDSWLPTHLADPPRFSPFCVG